MVASLKTEYWSVIWSTNTTPQDIPEGMGCKLLQKPMIISALFILDKLLETAKTPHNWQMDEENVVFIHNWILLSQKEWNFVICK
jgi:hypothetical protein